MTVPYVIYVFDFFSSDSFDISFELIRFCFSIFTPSLKFYFPKYFSQDAEWQPIHEAMRFLVLDVVKFLVEEAGIGVNTKCRVGTNIGTTPLGIALNNADGDETNDVVQYLIANGAERDASKVPFPKDSPSESMDEL